MRVSGELPKLVGVLLGVVGVAYWLLNGGPGAQRLVDLARDLWGAALR